MEAAQEKPQDDFVIDGPDEADATAEAITDQDSDHDAGTGADLATASPEEGEENTEIAGSIDGVAVEGPEGFQKAINKKHFQAKEAERERDAYRKELDELKAQQAPKPLEAVTVPPLPDSWDDSLDAKMKERDEAIAQNARFQEQQSSSAAQDARTLQEQQTKQAEHDQKLNDDFMTNADKLGVDRKSLGDSATAIANYGVTTEVAHHLMTDSEGPLMVQYLAANPLEIDALQTMTPIEAGMRLMEIKAKASAAKPKTSSTPSPAPSVSGKSSTPKDKYDLEGATYD